MRSREDMHSLIRGLAPQEVFDYYDGPKFYSCRDIVGQLYLVYWIEETDEGTSWLYLRVSQERYDALKHGDVGIANVLANPEDGTALFVRSVRGELEVVQLDAKDIDADWLPEPAAYINVETPKLPVRHSTPVELAPRAQRQVFDIAFEKLSNSYEMGAGKLGRLLEALQNTIYAFSCDPRLDVRRVPEDVKQRSEVMVTGLFASSFGVRMQTKGGALFEADDTERALQTLSEMIDILSEPSVVASDLHRLNILARSRFKHLLRVMVDAQVSIKCEWASPHGKSRLVSASHANISLSLQKLEAFDQSTSQVVERSARLVGVDVQSDFFALVLDDGDVIKGKLARSLAFRHFEVPSAIRAKLEETSIVDPLTDREKWTYTLLDLM
ncbi:hypothetical protein G7048_11690 [Diaphorobacter sp. HDW4B]|uniref:DUF6575 domain-containing protein n=1 Tax=Diaphorobacter sp. HDW4B TaxID=2714925 RepID=UPI00140AEE95|nr:DUF6575 domain-containing protein [Diaphorobacter sp. HDW4B]QIL70963.1 hypothetical protein G7048_11690 [Diaphorobacter sp. HDW4B]